MKKSKFVKLALIGSAASLLLVSCDDNKAEKTLSFKNEAECQKQFSAEECRKAFAESQKQYSEKAPKFTSLEECEKQYGPGKCTQGPVQANHEHGGGYFMPMMMGFMMGRMFGGATAPAYPIPSQPVPSAPSPTPPNRWGSATPSGNVANSNQTSSVKRGGFGSTGMSMMSSSGS
jgi:uncharacterized protein YgiB involved in biofilm formation